MIVPIIIAMVPLKRWLVVGVEMILPSVLLLLPPLIQEWGPTTRVLLHQPNFLQGNHATPWASLAPVMERAGLKLVNSLKYVKLANGHYRPVEVVTKLHAQAVLAAGPGRIVALLAACLIGVLVKVQKPSLPRIIWLAALALSLRCLFEPVMVPYYLLPGVALALLVATLRSRLTFAWVCAVSAVSSVVSYFHFSPWDYYLVVMCPLLAALAWSWPRRDASPRFISMDPQDSATVS